MFYVALIILVQAMYSAGDLIRKIILSGRPFDFAILKSVPLLLTFALSLVAFAIQLYVLKHLELSKTITLLGVCAVVFSAILGAVFLKEKLNAYNYAGLVFAVLAIILINIKK